MSVPMPPCQPLPPRACPTCGGKGVVPPRRDAVAAHIATLRDAGMSQALIARIYGVTRQAVSQRLHTHDRRKP